MTITEQNTLKIRMLLTELLNKEVTSRRLFVGYGLYCEKIIFGMYKDDKFYLKAEGALVDILKRYGAIDWKQINPTKPNSLFISHYYLIPDRLLNDKELFTQFLLKAIELIKQKEIEKETIIKSRIRQLPNLSMKHERWLGKIDIFNVEQFKEEGPYKCYVSLRKANLVSSAETFWLLYSAFLNKRIEFLTQKEKIEALDCLNPLLNQVGLRAIDISTP